MTGRPMRRATSSASPASSITPSEPGVTGTPAAIIVARAAALSPMRSIDSGAGPMNLTPCSRHSAENSARSARKPYPGWIASAPVCRAAWMRAGMTR